MFAFKKGHEERISHLMMNFYFRIRSPNIMLAVDHKIILIITVVYMLAIYVTLDLIYH